MKYFIKDNWWWMLIAVLCVIVTSLMVITTEYKNVNGVINSHFITSDRNGSAYYHTIVKSEDGYIDEVEGIGVYSMPIGTSINYRVERTHPIEIKF